MSILSRLTYSLEVKLNIFLQAFECERRIEDPELHARRRFTGNVFCENLKPHCYRAFDRHPKAVVLKRGLVEPQGFDEAVSRVRWTLSDILIY